MRGGGANQRICCGIRNRRTVATESRSCQINYRALFMICNIGTRRRPGRYIEQFYVYDPIKLHITMPAWSLQGIYVPETRMIRHDDMWATLVGFEIERHRTPPLINTNVANGLDSPKMTMTTTTKLRGIARSVLSCSLWHGTGGIMLLQSYIPSAPYLRWCQLNAELMEKDY